MAIVKEASRSLTTQALWATAAFLIVVITLIAVSLPIYVFPKTNVPTKTDAVMVLGPYWYQNRLNQAESLVEQGISDTLVISTPLEDGLPFPAKACNEERSYRVICFTPDPSTTQGEAQKLASLADENGWDNVTVVTNAPHITRARILFERCYHGELNMVSSPTHLSASQWAYEYVYQTAAFVKMALTPGC